MKVNENKNKLIIVGEEQEHINIIVQEPILDRGKLINIWEL